MPKFSVDWPRSGSMRRGTCSARATWAHRTGESASSFWPTATTANTTSDKAKYRRPTSGPSRGGPSFGLQDAVQMEWPTATLCGNYNRKGASATSGDGLATAVSQDEANTTQWATPRAEHDSGRHRGVADTLHSQIKASQDVNWLSPTVEDAGRMGSPEWAARWASGEVIPETQQRLRTQVLGEWSTPTAHDAKHATAPPAALNRNTDDLAVQSGASKAAPLNPAWVATLMGFPSDWCDLPPMQAPRKGSPSTVGPWAVDNSRRRTNRRAPPTES